MTARSTGSPSSARTIGKTVLVNCWGAQQEVERSQLDAIEQAQLFTWLAKQRIEYFDKLVRDQSASFQWLESPLTPEAGSFQTGAADHLAEDADVRKRISVLSLGWPQPVIVMYAVGGSQPTAIARQHAAPALTRAFLPRHWNWHFGDVLFLNLTLNCLIYATFFSFAFASIAAGRAIVKRHRRSRGRCARCDYPVDEGATRCPECGTNTQLDHL